MKRRRSSSGASERYHNRVARRYDALYDDPYWAFHDELTWARIRPHIPPDLAAPCLDLGCGTGAWGLRLLKTGLPVTFIDHSGVMVEQARNAVTELSRDHPARAQRATFVIADMIDLSAITTGPFALTLAMGDPLSICSDPFAAAGQMYKNCRPGGVVIATVDNKFAALDYYAQQGNLDNLETFVATGRTHWLTREREEQFELTTFTPATLKKLFERVGFTVQSIIGKTILPVRKNPELLNQPNAIDRLLKLESDLASDPTAAARANHLQITAKRPEKGE
jgi:SAM-dependent methyltransferase